MKEGIRREYKKQYDASTKKIDVVDVPEFNFLMVDGIGNPNVEEFKLKAEALHILSKAIKDYFKEKMDLLYFKSEKENGRFISNNISLSIITTKYMYEQYLIEH